MGTPLNEQYRGGIEVLRNHDGTWGVLETRKMRYGLVMDGLDELLRPKLSKKGDINIATFWPAESRPLHGWSYGWPVVVTGSGSSTEIREPTDPDSPDAPRTPPPPATTPSDPPAAGPSSKGSGGSGGPVLVKQDFGGPGGGVEPGLRPPSDWGEGGTPITGEDSSGASLLPIYSSSYAPDTAFQVRPAPPRPGWPRFPRGTVGSFFAGSIASKHSPVFVHGDPRLVAVNEGDSPSMGSLVFDTDGTGGYGIGARLQAAWRVIPPLQGMVPSPGNGLAWQLCDSRRDRLAGYGAIIDRHAVGGEEGGKPGVVGSQNALVVALSSARVSGPLEVGHHAGDNHRLGNSGTRAVNAEHIQAGALFYAGRSWDAPLEFQLREYPKPPPLPLISRVHLVFDHSKAHFWFGGSAPGLWRWYAEVPFMTTPGTPGPPPPTTPPVPPPPTTPPPSPPPPPGGGPLTPGGGDPPPGGGDPPPGTGYPGYDPKTGKPIPGWKHDNIARPGALGTGDAALFAGDEGSPLFGAGGRPSRGAMPDGLASREQASGPQTPPDDRTDTGGGFDPYVDEEGYDRPWAPRPNPPPLFRRPDEGPELEPPFAWPRNNPPIPDGRPQGTPSNPEPIDSRIENPTIGPWRQGYSPLQGYVSFPGSTAFNTLLFRPQHVTAGYPDLRVQTNPRPELARWAEEWRPVVLRAEPFGAEFAGQFVKQDGAQRYAPGTAQGGILFMAPQRDLSDTDRSETLPTATTPYVAAWGAWFAVGTPVRASGLIATGHRWGAPSAGTLQFQTLDAAGAGTAAFTLGTDGEATIERQMRWAGFITDTPGGSQNDYSPTGFAGAVVLRIGQTIANIDITGIAGGVNGRVLAVFAKHDNTKYVTLKSESASSSAANRFRFATSGGDLPLAPGDGVLLVYSTTSNRWERVGSPRGSQFITEIVSPAQITASQNDYNPHDSSTRVLRLTTDASRNVTGLAGGIPGRVLTIFNVGSNDLVLTNEDAASSAANRFAIGSDLTLPASGSVSLWYDGTDSRWRAT